MQKHRNIMYSSHRQCFGCEIPCIGAFIKSKGPAEFFFRTIGYRPVADANRSRKLRFADADTKCFADVETKSCRCVAKTVLMI